MMERRQFVLDLALLGVAAGVATRGVPGADDEPTARRIPRWRGFNLRGRFGWPGRSYDGPAFEKGDFAAMAEWGFDFARLPLSYWSWGSRDDWSVVREEPLKQIDRAVELGRRYGVHVNINFHRLPGYCISAREREPADLFSGRKAKAVSHYTATWVPKDEFESFVVPTWPLQDDKGTTWDKERLRKLLIEPWQRLAEKGVAVHVGEWGCFNKTPHAVALAWTGDYLSLWKEAGWGWALWNLRGSFGVMDSEREDVSYEDFKGHKLDREMLELLRRH